MLLVLLVACGVPVAAPPPPTCAVGELADGDTCVPVACGVGPWGGVEADAYVLSGATGGDGSAAAPFATITEALGAATIAVGAGTYAETPELTVDITLLGRCAVMVTLDQSGGGLIASDVDLTIRGFTLADAPDVALAAIGRSVVDGTDLVITDPGQAGVYVEGDQARLTLAESRVEGGADAYGAIAAEQGTLGLGAVDIVGVGKAGIYAVDTDTRVDLVGVSIDDAGDGGIRVSSGAVLVGAGVTVNRSVAVGVAVDGPGSAVTLVASALLGTVPDAAGSHGEGLRVEGGAAATLRIMTLEGNSETGLRVSGVGSTVELTSVTVSDTRASPTDGLGFGMVVDDAAVATVEEVTVSDSVGVGVFVNGGTVTGVDLLAWRTRSNGYGAFGRGVVAQGGAQVDLDWLWAVESQEVGIFVAGVGTRVSTGGGIVSFASPSDVGTGGMGWVVRDGAEVHLAGGVYETVGVGLYATGVGTRVEVGELLQVERVSRSDRHPLAVGVLLEDGASIVASDYFQAMSVDGPGLVVRSGASFRAPDFVYLDAQFAGVIVEDAELDVPYFDVYADADAAFGGGVGMVVVASDAGTTSVAVGSLQTSAEPLVALWVDGPAEVRVEGGRLRGGAGVGLEGGPTIMGNALFARGGPDLTLNNTRFEDSPVAVLLDGATASGLGNTFDDNGVDLIQQGCGDLPPPDLGADPAKTVLCPDADQVVVPLSWSFPDPGIWPM